MASDFGVTVSPGIGYAVVVDSPASGADVARVVSRDDQVAEIPRFLRAGTSVERTRA